MQTSNNSAAAAQAEEAFQNALEAFNAHLAVCAPKLLVDFEPGLLTCRGCGHRLDLRADYAAASTPDLSTAKCASCGKAFQPKRADAAYCSNACRQAAHRKRVTDHKGA